MIEFTFTHKTLGVWQTTITLIKGMTGGQAFEDACAQYKSFVFPDWVPGHTDVVIQIKGV